MRHALAVLLCQACSCHDAEIRPDGAPDVAVELPIGYAVERLSAGQCQTACTAAERNDCDQLTQFCNRQGGPDAYVWVGGYPLQCRSAEWSACFGAQTGIPWCVSDCTADAG